MLIGRSHINPTISGDLAQAEALEDAGLIRRRTLEKKFEKWKNFEESDYGRAAQELADPVIEYLDSLLSMTLDQVMRGFSLLTIEAAREQRAMWRGQKLTWSRIKTGSGPFLKQLAEGENGEVPKEKNPRVSPDNPNAPPEWKPDPGR